MSCINRHITNNFNGPVEVQKNDYYPFCGIIADLSTGRDVQNHTYNAKEQDFANNLFWLGYSVQPEEKTITLGATATVTVAAKTFAVMEIGI